jgi:hypothetical protein
MVQILRSGAGHIYGEKTAGTNIIKKKIKKSLFNDGG